MDDNRGGDIVERVEELLASENTDQPLYDSLSALYESHKRVLQRIDRVTNISDKYQFGANSEKANISSRFEKSLRQLERIARISDRYQTMLRELYVDLKHASTHDYLTELANRRSMVERLSEEASRAQRTTRTFAIVLTDIDFFKQINDSHGHSGGDAVLVEYSRAAKAQLREYDLISRWGGEEFLTLLPETSIAEALDIAERLRAAALEFCVDSVGASIQMTVSCGVAEYNLGEAPDETIKRADAALYCAKNSGRNRVFFKPITGDFQAYNLLGL